MVSCEELLRSIRTGMRLDKDFFLRIYGYEVSYPNFSVQAIQALEHVGCSGAKEYYHETVSEYERMHDKELRPVAVWYCRELEKKWGHRERGEHQRDQRKNDSLARRKEKLIGLIGKLESR